jgi:hypothetical protein
MLSIVATFAVLLLAMAPGLILLRGMQANEGHLAAAAAASIAATSALTALVGAGLQATINAQLPAWSIAPISVIASAVAVYLTRASGRSSWTFDWRAAALGAIFSGYGFYVQAIAIEEARDGALLIHGWYNADWFKHLGHVNALANFGVPARDIFNQAAPLHYYWLIYIIPGAGSLIGGDSWAALNALNGVIVFLFSTTFYGVIRLGKASPNASLFVALIGLIACSPMSVALHLVGGTSLDAIFAGGGVPKSPALMSLSQYIPQHTFVLALLLGWVLIEQSGDSARRSSRLLSLAGLATAMTVSTLLGAMVLGVYGLLRLWRGGTGAIGEVATMALASCLLVVLLGVVQISDPSSAIDSPLLTNAASTAHWSTRATGTAIVLIARLGLPFLLAVVLFRLWKPERTEDVFARQLCIILILVGISAAMVAEVAMTARLALEARIRAVNLPAIGIAIIGAWAVRTYLIEATRQRIVAAIAVLAVTAFALPAAVVRTAWHGQIGDAYTTRISSDDRSALAALRRHSDPTAIALQFPEPPVLAAGGGRDAWVATIAGRTVNGSLRATDYASAAPRIDAAKRFYDLSENDVPDDVDWVYLSRSLHPDSYDAIVARLSGDSQWRSLVCYVDACVFGRRETAR